MKKILSLALLTATLLVAGRIVKAEEAPKTILFVCEHGAAKSVIAVAYFNRLAEEQKINVRAISRGTTPDEKVPPFIVANLKKDGLDLGAFTPTKLAKKDADQAVAIVAFCEIPKEIAEPARVSSWLDTPSFSTDYEKAKAVMLSRVETLVAELKGK